MNQKLKNIFVTGAISPAFIGEKIAAHQSKTSIGGHSIFLGQVRADTIDNKQVVSVDYTSYEPMALELMAAIREMIIEKYSLNCMHVYHSLGKIWSGEICLFVFTSAPHRKDAIDACSETVERLKAELPIWGKEIFGDGSFQWKMNQPV
ncbi:MAG TPA: molybdenum cofactor biosynthesis protein MoaE [Puia sp.]|jgi:molybdopterin synthase catalytic subunit|nr:molybdenum cofactor biosynthesis protein MoaE [Puia sp.]